MTEEVESLLTDDLVGTGTNTGTEQQSESNLIGNEYLLENLRKLERIKARRGMRSRGYKDPGVGRPPKNRVKKDPDEAMIQYMYQRVGYITKKGFINIEVGQGARSLRQMNEEECEAHVVGIILAQMHSLKKGTELFGEKAEKATMTELSQIDDFETYFPLHKHKLSKQDT